MRESSAGSCSPSATRSTCSRRGFSAPRAGGRSSATCSRTSPGRSSCWRRSTSRTRSCSSPGCRSSAWGRSRRRRSGARWWPRARSTSSGGGSGRSRGSPSSPSCSRSTSSATACATCSTLARRAATRRWSPERPRGRLAARAAADAFRRRHHRRRRRLRRRGGRGARRRGGERQRQDHLHARAPRPPPGAVDRARDGALRGTGPHHHAAARAARHRRSRPGDGVPGPVHVAPSHALGRQAADRARAPPPAPRSRRVAAARGRAARGCPHPRPRGGAARLPSSLLRRDAAAHRHRHRARVPAEAPDRGRADDGARRHRAGRDPPAPRPAAARARARGHPHHPRPRRPVVDRRPRLHLLRGAGRGVRRARRRAHTSAAPVHARAAGRAAAPGGVEGAPAGRHRRRPAGAGPPAHRLRVQSALRARGRNVPPRGPAARRRGRPPPRVPRRPLPRMSALELRDVVVDYDRRGGGSVRAVAGASLVVERGRIVGLVGESGCGKSTLARAAVGLVPVAEGSVEFEGTAVTPLSRRARPEHLVRLQLVFQNPYSSLNPRRTAGSQIADGLKGTRAARAVRVRELCEVVGLPGTVTSRYPHEFSGGQRQRIAIARALASSPSVIVLDEPLASLDASAQAQLANLLANLARDLEVGLLLISHDLAIVRHVADEVSVMYLGKMAETGPTLPLWTKPAHPYSEALIAAVPRPDGAGFLPESLPGEVPDPAHPPAGCRFHPRCPYVFERCRVEEPRLEPLPNDRFAACWLAGSKGLG
ncbi:MAG: ABC transporter ATP-binding protein [Actinobacteria bacterium]|nr:ABC transporter ATP-binding protein [Actinomycetota bacterium]